MLQSDQSDQSLTGLILSRELLSLIPPTDLQPSLSESILRLLDHSEPKLRIHCAEVLESMGKTDGNTVFFEFFTVITHRIDSLIATNGDPLLIETYFRAILPIIESFIGHFDEETTVKLVDLITFAVGNRGKYMRETGQTLLKHLCTKSSPDSLPQTAYQIVTFLANGLEDPWGPVRLLSLAATKAFVSVIGTGLQPYDPILLPRICLNRCFTAEGVRNQAIEAWKMYVGENGRGKIAEFAKEVSQYYGEMCVAETPAVREAACLCIAELASKVAPSAHSSIAPYSLPLLSTVTQLLTDPDWTVQETASLACSELTIAFPTETLPHYPVLKAIWFSRLSDPRVSMRESAAVGLTKAASSPDLWTELVTYIEHNGKKAWDQAAYERGNPPRGKAGPAYPWELSDGCVFLVREMAVVRPAAAAAQLPLLGDLSRVKNFSAHIFLKDSVWRSVPVIAKAMGKRAFKDQLELFIDELFLDANNSVENVKAVASECIRDLNRLIGPAIFRGRVEMRNSEFGRVLGTVLAERS